MELRSLVLAVTECRAQESMLKEQLRDAEGRTVAAEQALMDAMESEGLKTINVDGVGRATVRKPRLYARYDVQDLEKAMDWLRQGGHGDAIRPSVHHSTFSAIVQEHLDMGQVLPECIKLSYVPSLSIQKEASHERV